MPNDIDEKGNLFSAALGSIHRQVYLVNAYEQTQIVYTGGLDYSSVGRQWIVGETVSVLDKSSH